MNSSHGSFNDMRDTVQSSDAVVQDPQTQALVAFPSVPRPGQSPTLGAKHILGFHQSLLRTIPILFTPGSLHFWRDELFQEAWGCDYLYLILIALGNVHRAALLTVSKDVEDRANSLSTKITAVQIYIEALEALSRSLEEAGNHPVLLVAVLALMAYFEVSHELQFVRRWALTLGEVVQWQHSRLCRTHPGRGTLLENIAVPS
jgi:hypothetical protein